MPAPQLRAYILPVLGRVRIDALSLLRDEVGDPGRSQDQGVGAGAQGPIERHAELHGAELLDVSAPVRGQDRRARAVAAALRGARALPRAELPHIEGPAAEQVAAPTARADHPQGRHPCT
jgi:hypothetical protein